MSTLDVAPLGPKVLRGIECGHAHGLYGKLPI